MFLQNLLLASAAAAVSAEQLRWSLETSGKPEKMLQVGRLPALGCSPSFPFADH
jgi:hypothetical protein